MNINEIEKEIIYLLVIKKHIDEMVNFEVMDIVGTEPDMNIMFKSMSHQKFFNIMLVDFLSCTDARVIGEERPYLRALTFICDNPNFNQDNSIDNLKGSTLLFREWLNKEFIVEDFYLPSIELKTNLSIKRLEFIKICGNISKHNFTRLSGVVDEIISIFNRNKISLNDENALTILEEFYDWFHSNVLNYHSSAIAEFLNNIRWGIYEYLKTEFNQSIVYDSAETLHKYTYPSNVNNRFAQKCYWNLMNEVRKTPYMPKFDVSKYLKKRY